MAYIVIPTLIIVPIVVMLLGIQSLRETEHEMDYDSDSEDDSADYQGQDLALGKTEHNHDKQNSFTSSIK